MPADLITAFPRQPQALRLLPLAAVLTLALAGCAAVGPNYEGAPKVASDATQADHFNRADQAQGTVSNGPAAAQWWLTLNDPVLTSLIDQALKDSPNVHAAQARLRQSRAALKQQQANELPKASASALGIGVRQGPDTDAAQTLHLYSAGFDASWEIDLFGGTRRAVEAASAEAQAVQADLADAQVSLAAEVAQSYAGLREQQQRQALLRQTATGDEQSLALSRQRRERGVAPAQEVEQRLSQLESTRASLAEVAAQLSASLDQLAFLTGQSSGSLDARLAAPQGDGQGQAQAALPALPSTVAVGDPTTLLSRRPDIRAAERRLASRQAQIGTKVANYFPKLSLLGNIGFSSTEASHLVRQENFSMLGVPYLSWNLFDFGQTRSQVRQAEATRDEYVARYENTVLTALRDANTALSRFGHQREELLSLMAQEASTTRKLDLMRQRRQAGTASQIDLLDAQRELASARQRTVSGQAELVKDFVSLQKSLGLGWAAEAS
ncbi:MAG TPA: efflux transporter outer membrane subunit [Candidatus Aquabacterium excrementipullorum]|nr:efflux transporter outer membrane subunit [Candidatus Aquabacterium excrementipullorum]